MSKEIDKYERDMQDYILSCELSLEYNKIEKARVESSIDFYKAQLGNVNVQIKNQSENLTMCINDLEIYKNEQANKGTDRKDSRDTHKESN